LTSTRPHDCSASLAGLRTGPAELVRAPGAEQDIRGWRGVVVFAANSYHPPAAGDAAVAWKAAHAK
jgi:hypothetical protein